MPVIVYGKLKGVKIRRGGFLCAKARYPNEASAMEALRDCQRTPQDERKEIRVYQCLHCNGWHLTSQAKRDEPVT